MDRQSIRTGIWERWGDAPFVPLCLTLTDKILALRPDEATQLTYRQILHLVEQDQVSPELLAALNVLTTSEFAFLKAGGLFIDEDDGAIELSDDEFQSVVSQNALVHPRTGEPVEDPAAQVSPFFTLATEVTETGE